MLARVGVQGGENVLLVGVLSPSDRSKSAGEASAGSMNASHAVKRLARPRWGVLERERAESDAMRRSTRLADSTTSGGKVEVAAAGARMRRHGIELNFFDADSRGDAGSERCTPGEGALHAPIIRTRSTTHDAALGRLPTVRDRRRLPLGSARKLCELDDAVEATEGVRYGSYRVLIGHVAGIIHPPVPASDHSLYSRTLGGGASVDA
jgi:hypothetical protein